MPIVIETPLEQARTTVQSGRNIIAAHIKAYGEDSDRIPPLRAILARREAELAALEITHCLTCSAPLAPRETAQCMECLYDSLDDEDIDL